jgi:holo-[acyl-carrier protein] synthase
LPASLDVRVGVDVVTIERVARLITEIPGVVYDFVTDRELAACSRGPAQIRIARLFAGKEAVLKVLGTGLRRGMRWKDIEIVGESLHDPRVVLHGAIHARAQHCGFFDSGASLSVSLAHNRRLAIAIVVAARPGDAPGKRRRRYASHPRPVREA